MYIQYNMNQTTLPLELSACIDPDHIVFSIYNFIESLDEKHFESCLQLPSDSTSRWTPLSLANSSYCKGL
ncbi:hypothetical protein [Aerococcus tenax]|uniref:hypothetical protein n=1 Tax=Aerococcus tenax TaxID=3078812 RepID=UPI002FDA5D51